MVDPPAPGAHGGDGPALARRLGLQPDLVLDLSASLNPLAPDVAAVVRRHAGHVARYPDAAHATGLLAEAIGVEASRLLLTNGGAEAIALTAAELTVGRVDEPDFSLYRRHLAAVTTDGPRWRSNPHNPTGLLAPPDEVAAVWDEAFFALATGAWTRGDVGSIVVGSLTKLWACPGLRLGYVIAPDDAFADALRSRQPQWSVNALALAAVPDLLAATDLAAWAKGTAELRAALVTVLTESGLRCLPSDANWVLVSGAGRLRTQLAAQAILIRDCASFGMPDTVRIAVPDLAGLSRLQHALEALDETAGEAHL